MRAKEDNLNDVCLESSKPAVVNHGQGSQDSNNVKTKVELSSIHRETVASSIRVAPASSKSSSGGSGGSSNPTLVHPKSKSIYVMPEMHEVTHVVRHHDQDERETDAARHWDGVLSVLKGKIRNQLEKEFTEVAPLRLSWKHQDNIRNL